MLSEVFIDGYKSLHNFTLKLDEGLNVIIGPNGAGKSNICSAINLLSYAMTGELIEFVLSQGGSDAIFSKCKKGEKKITLRCTGLKNFTEKDISQTFKYSYEIVIAAENSTFNYSEIFTLSYLSKTKTGLRRYLKIVDGSSINNTAKIKIYRKEHLGPVSMSSLKTSKDKTITINASAEDRNMFLCVILGSYFYYCYSIFEDIGSAKVWNIDPHNARIASDMIDSNKMLPNGKGLANLLYMLQEKKKDKYNEIDQLMKRIVSGYKEMNIQCDSSDFKRSILVTTQNDITTNTNCLSDGTIKLLGLISGVIGQNNSLVIIEELENYLHPWACSLLIEYFREISKNKVILITTHSESVLNALSPKEILIVTNEEGETKVKYLKNEKQIVQAIEESGFGCGYHYSTGNLGGVL